MGAATVVEKHKGTGFVAEHIYGAWWFTALWALLVAAGTVWMVHRRMKKPSAVVLHLSFVVILAGALLTHLTSHQGTVHLRMGQTTTTYLATDGHTHAERPLPFSMRLDTFSISYHEGTRAAADYVSRFSIMTDDGEQTATVSMNRIFSHGGIRFYQSSFDDDLRGSHLSMNSDPWGMPVTYTGYALLFVGLLWMLVDPKGAYRRLLRSPGLRRCAVMAALLLLSHGPLSATTDRSPLPPTLSAESASLFGQLYMDYNDRICPVQTFALDFTKKLCGRRSYRGLSAEQVLAGFIFWSHDWSREPIIKVKSGPLREAAQIGPYCSVDDLFSPTDGYKLGPLLSQYYQGNRDKLHQEVMKMDDRLQLIMQLRQGPPLRLFPATVSLSDDSLATSRGKRLSWYAPTDQLPAAMEPQRRQYIQSIFGIMAEAARLGDDARLDEALTKLQLYQKTYGGASIPSATKSQAEHLYNAIPFATILFMANLTLGLLLLFYFIRQAIVLTDSQPHASSSPFSFTRAASLLLFLSWAALTLCLALRWIISGTIPMSNGYETMLLMAWFIMLVSLLAQRRAPIILCFGFLMSGFFLLVSHISQMDPQITHLMPVLSSPLLTIHVGIIMMAFALLALTFICGLTALLLSMLTSRRSHLAAHLASLALLSRLFLYPALTCLGFGIFIGAIWANVSWGNYWSWDPKETWALITFMVYAVALHDASLPFLRRPMGYHLYVTLAFLTILMTYFGVNYFLGGMHSYA